MREGDKDMARTKGAKNKITIGPVRALRAEIPEQTYNLFKAAAARQGVTITALTRTLIENYLKEKP
jgi:hypothetical protein